MNGRTVVVIGGSSGIGFEIARQAGAQGARLIIVRRDETRLSAAAKNLGGSVKTFAADAHDEKAVDDLFVTLGPFDHLVSMVRDSMAGGFLDTTLATMQHVLQSKFLANWAIARHAARNARSGGSLTFTSGTGGRAQEVSASYVANLGISALVQGLASELAPHIRVNAVAPTFMGTGTGFWSHVPPEELAKLEASFAETVPLRRLGTVQEIASTYLHLMSNGFINGQVVAVDGGVMLRK
jgi:NAD(P)-dependent dehydrogenase (short-subunit alcohol dehydrogenase family)